MKVAVLGSNGFMGKYFTTKCPDWVGISRQDLDLTDQEAVETFFNTFDFDVVVHCAVKGGSMLVEETGDVTHDNILMFENVARVFKGKLIYMSSGAAKSGNPPSKPYGLSKWMIEKRIQHIPNVYTLRVFGCYGSGDGSSMYRDRFKSICKRDGHIIIEKDKYFDMIDVEDVLSIVKKYVNGECSTKELDLVYDTQKLLSERAVYFGATYTVNIQGVLDTPYVSERVLPN